MRKVTKNLTLDADAVSRAERFARRQGTSVSAVVNRLLSTLPADEREDDWPAELPPAVKRLIGVGGRDEAGVDAYHDHLITKHVS